MQFNEYFENYTIFCYINGLKYRSSVTKEELNNFISLTELRNKQIDVILED